jgi:hypothetical protein
MPDIFKALATIMAWCLFIVSWITGLSAFGMGILSGELYGGGGEPSMIYPVMFALSAAMGVLAVVVMILRKKME